MKRFEALKLEMVPRRSRRVSDFFKEFIRIRLVQNRPKTIEMYQYCFKDFVRICGDKVLRNLGPFDIENFKVGRLGDKVDPITVNIQLKHLRAAFRACVRLKFISESPCEGVPFLRLARKEAVYMTEGQFGRLLMMIPDNEFKNLVCTTVLTAMRRGEVINLAWRHVDFERQKILIRPFGDFQPKGRHIRDIPMNWWVLNYLRQKPKTSEYVFGRPDGLPFKGNTVNQKLKRYVRRAEMDGKLHFHSLRHTGISLLIKKGVPPSYVQRIAGHSSLIVTQGYIHVEDDELLTAINTLNPPILN